jgi:hypothetical protein
MSHWHLGTHHAVYSKQWEAARALPPWRHCQLAREAVISAARPSTPSSCCRRFHYFFFLNSSVRGPFAPLWVPPGWHWTHAYLRHLSPLGGPDVHAVASSLACLPEVDAGRCGRRAASGARLPVDILGGHAGKSAAQTPNAGCRMPPHATL